MIKGTVRAPGDVIVEKSDDKTFTTRQVVLLRRDDLFVVLNRTRYHHGGEIETDDERQARDSYFFEEHSCPTNWLRDCVVVIENGDTDPHGFLEFVRAVDVPEDFDADDRAVWIRLFPEAFPADKQIDGEVVRHVRVLKSD